MISNFKWYPHHWFILFPVLSYALLHPNISVRFISVFVVLGLGKLWSDSRNKKIIRFHILDRNVITMNRIRQWPKHERENNNMQQQNQQQHKKMHSNIYSKIVVSQKYLLCCCGCQKLTLEYTRYQDTNHFFLVVYAYCHSA